MNLHYVFLIKSQLVNSIQFLGFIKFPHYNRMAAVVNLGKVGKNFVDEEGELYNLHNHPGETYAITPKGFEAFLNEHLKDTDEDKKSIPCFAPSSVCKERITPPMIQQIVSPEFFTKFFKSVPVKSGLSEIVPLYNVALNDTKSTDELGFGDIYHYSMCPYCLQIEKRESGCIYLTHEKPVGLNSELAPFCQKHLVVSEILKKYMDAGRAQDPGMPDHLEFCAECGSPCWHHRHFDSYYKEFYMDAHYVPKLMPQSGVGKCPLKHGRQILIARMLAVRDIYADKTIELPKDERKKAAFLADTAVNNALLMARAEKIVKTHKWNTNVPKTKIYKNAAYGYNGPIPEPKQTIVNKYPPQYIPSEIIFSNLAENKIEQSLVEAITNNYVGIVLHILRTNDIDVNKTMTEYWAGWTPINVAAASNSVEVIEILLKYGADVNGKTTDGMTSLNTACYAGHENAVKFLIENGASVNLGTEIDASYVEYPLENAIRSQNLNIIRELISHGAVINPVNSSPALNLAFMWGNVQIVDFFIENGAELNRIDKKGFTSLFFAANYGYSGIIDKIIKKLIKNISTGKKTDFELLVNTQTTVQFDLPKYPGANTVIVIKPGMTPLMAAAKRGFFQTSITLCQWGADKNLRDSEGKSADDYAASDENLRKIIRETKPDKMESLKAFLATFQKPPSKAAPAVKAALAAREKSFRKGGKKIRKRTRKN